MKTHASTRPGTKTNFIAALAAAAAIVSGSHAAVAAGASPGVVLPAMDAAHGKAVFAAKGCVVCHSINGIGGEDAAPLDAADMDPAGNPFVFFSRMLAGMKPMLDMQEDELGHLVELDATELGDLVAFIHDSAAQKSFSRDDIPADVQKLMERD